jgi:hypothetical protein
LPDVALFARRGAFCPTWRFLPDVALFARRSAKQQRHTRQATPGSRVQIHSFFQKKERKRCAFHRQARWENSLRRLPQSNTLVRSQQGDTLMHPQPRHINHFLAFISTINVDSSNILI